MIGPTQSSTRARKPTPKQRVLELDWSRPYARYTRGKYQRTPKWADRGAMLLIYKEARRLTLLLGVRHVVDHIVPLHGGIVSGLHVPANLRVVSWQVNANKGARWWPDMPAEQEALL